MGGDPTKATGWWVHNRIDQFDESKARPGPERLIALPIEVGIDMLPEEQRSEWSKHPAVVCRKGDPEGARYLIPGALQAIREGVPGDLVRAAWDCGAFGPGDWRELHEQGAPFGPIRREFARRRRPAYTASRLKSMSPEESVRFFADSILAAEETAGGLVIGRKVVAKLRRIEGVPLLQVLAPLLSKPQNGWEQHPLYMDDPRNPKHYEAYFHHAILDERNLRRIEASGIDGDWARSLVVLRRGSVAELLNPPVARDFALILAE
jgi:hypothetical protein